MSEARYTKLAIITQPPISGSRPSGGVNTETEGVPSLGGENIISSGGVTYDVIKKIPLGFYNFMPKGKLKDFDVLINKDGAQTGKIGLYRLIFKDAAVNEHLFIIRPKEGVQLDSIYLYYSLLLGETQRKIESRITGSAQPGLNSQFVKYVDIPFCGYPIQKKIASILQTIDQAIEKTEALIEKYQQTKAGLMHDLFTRGITDDGKLRPPREQAPELYQETLIGWIPKEWQVELLDDLTTKIVDGVHHTPKYVEHGIPFVTVKNLTASSDINFDKLNYIDKKTHSECYSRADPKAGDVLVTKDGTLGVSRIVKVGMPEFSIFVSVALLRVTESLTAGWLHFFFDSGIYLKQLGHLSSGTGLKHIHLEHFKKFKIVLPSKEEQLRIISKVKIIEDKMAIEKLLLSKLTKQKSGLMHDLLTGKVSVEIAKGEALNA